MRYSICFTAHIRIVRINDTKILSSSVSRLGDIRADNDANCTYEGENNVLVQQASNWLLNQWDNLIKGRLVPSPFGSVEFLPVAEKILSTKFDKRTVDSTLEPKCMRKFESSTAIRDMLY